MNKAAEPIVYCFKSTVDMTKIHWLNAAMASATDKGEIVNNETTVKEAFELGNKAVAP